MASLEERLIRLGAFFGVETWPQAHHVSCRARIAPTVLAACIMCPDVGWFNMGALCPASLDRDRLELRVLEAKLHRENGHISWGV